MSSKSNKQKGQKSKELNQLWSRPAVQGPAPTARCAHAAAPMEGKMFVFGGWNGVDMLNDLFLHQQDTSTWTKPVCLGTPPSRRAGHTLSVVGAKLFVFGGGDGDSYLNDLHVLDTDTMEWSQVYVAGTSPAARSRHCAAVVGHRIFVFAGGDDKRIFDDVYVLDTMTKTWHRADTKLKGSSIGNLARWGHSCVPYTYKVKGETKTLLIVFGGRNEDITFNDILVLDTDTMEWTNQQCSGEPPTARAGHTAQIFGHQMFVVGGGDGTGRMLNDLVMLNTDTWTWWRSSFPLGQVPQGRCAHTACVENGQLLIVGGSDGTRRFRDLYVLDGKRLLKDEDDLKLQLKDRKKEERSGRRKRGGRSSQSQADRNNSATSAPQITGGYEAHMLIPPEPAVAVNPEVLRAYRDNNIVQLLTSLGMRQHADSFLCDGVDAQTIPLLSEDDLQRLGMPLLGPRRRLMSAAIAAREELRRQALIYRMQNPNKRHHTQPVVKDSTPSTEPEQHMRGDGSPPQALPPQPHPQTQAQAQPQAQGPIPGSANGPAPAPAPVGIPITNESLLSLSVNETPSETTDITDTCSMASSLDQPSLGPLSQEPYRNAGGPVMMPVDPAGTGAPPPFPFQLPMGQMGGFGPMMSPLTQLQQLQQLLNPAGGETPAPQPASIAALQPEDSKIFSDLSRSVAGLTTAMTNLTHAFEGLSSEVHQMNQAVYLGAFHQQGVVSRDMGTSTAAADGQSVSAQKVGQTAKNSDSHSSDKPAGNRVVQPQIQAEDAAVKPKPTGASQADAAKTLGERKSASRDKAAGKPQNGQVADEHEPDAGPHPTMARSYSASAAHKPAVDTLSTPGGGSAPPRSPGRKGGKARGRIASANQAVDLSGHHTVPGATDVGTGLGASLNLAATPASSSGNQAPQTRATLNYRAAAMRNAAPAGAPVVITRR